MTFPRSIVAGLGAFLPETVLSNAELARRVDTSDDWIVSRTGIRRRRIAGEHEKTSDLALKAATPDEAAIQARLTPTFTALTGA